MCLFKFDKEKYEDTLKREGKQEGIREGALKSIEMLYELNLPFIQIVAALKNKFGYSEAEAINEIHSLYPDFS